MNDDQDDRDHDIELAINMEFLNLETELNKFELDMINLRLTNKDDIERQVNTGKDEWKAIDKTLASIKELYQSKASNVAEKKIFGVACDNKLEALFNKRYKLALDKYLDAFHARASQPMGPISNADRVASHVIGLKTDIRKHLADILKPQLSPTSEATTIMHRTKAASDSDLKSRYNKITKSDKGQKNSEEDKINRRSTL